MPKVDVYRNESRKAEFDGEMNWVNRSVKLGRYSTFRKLDYIGEFLGFGLCVIEGDDCNYAPESCAIVARDDGTVKNVPLELIKFHQKGYFTDDKPLAEQVTPKNQKHIPGLLITHNNN